MFYFGVAIGVFLGMCLGICVMGLLAGRQYMKGYKDGKGNTYRKELDV